MGIGKMIMGAVGAPPSVALAPANPPCGVLVNYCVQQPTTLVIKEKMLTFSGDDFSVKDQHGQVVVRCSGKVLSFRDAKAAGHYSSSSTKLITIHKAFYAEDPNGREIFQVRKHFSIVTTKMSATFVNAATGTQATISLKGDMWGMSGTLMLDERIPVAQISRQYLNGREIIGGQQTYTVAVAPGVDLALMTAICICFDEAKNESQ